MWHTHIFLHRNLSSSHFYYRKLVIVCSRASLCNNWSLLGISEAVFLVIFGASSFPAWHEVYGKSIKEFVPSQKRARSHLVSNLSKTTVSEHGNLVSVIVYTWELDRFFLESYNVKRDRLREIFETITQKAA